MDETFTRNVRHIFTHSHSARIFTFTREIDRCCFPFHIQRLWVDDGLRYNQEKKKKNATNTHTLTESLFQCIGNETNAIQIVNRNFSFEIFHFDL